jgi:putative FmdB family regulatory protein
MPTYEYDCRGCGERVEFFQSMSEAPKRKCPQCGSPNGLKRRIGSGAGIIFRGSGFYETDYRSDSYRKQAKKENGSSKDTTKGSEKKDASKTDSSKKSTAPKETSSPEPVKAAGS